MRKLATVMGLVTWFVAQFFGTLGLCFFLGGREGLTGDRLFLLFVVHSVFWGVMQVGILKADLNKIQATIRSGSYDSHKW